VVGGWSLGVDYSETFIHNFNITVSFKSISGRRVAVLNLNQLRIGVTYILEHCL